MEWEAFKFIWTTVLTVGMAIIGFIWKNLVDKVEKVHDRAENLEKELTKVKVDYVQKEEINRIENRIDTRFVEMKEFILQIVRK
jgi:hypothetical protein